VPLPRVLYTGEGLNESVAVTTDEQVRLFHVSGKIEASTAPKDMRLQRMLGSLPALVHPGPRSVLVVGFGAGVTAGTFLDYPSVQRVVICELEPLIPQHVGPFFAAENHRVATDPRVTIVHDDARHFMLTSKEHFDVITSDPIHPWVRGSAVLYSREYFELVRARLAPGGLVTQWVPLYQSSEATIREELATFMTAFPGATVWANRDRGQGYDLVLLGGAAPTRIALDVLSERWNAPDHDAARRVLAAAGFADWSDLLATYAGRQSDLTPWLAGAEINEDRSLHLMYQAGLESLIEQEGDIYARMSQYRAFPQDLFVGTPENVERVIAKGAE
jgi:spermidine synthase